MRLTVNYFSRRRANARKTIQEQKEELIDSLLQGQFTHYDEILTIIRQYAEEAIYSAQDAMGNSIMHMVLSGKFILIDEANNLDKNNGISSKTMLQKNILVGTIKNSTEDELKETGKSGSILPLMHFLVQCANTSKQQSDELVIFNTSRLPHSSMLHHRSAGGSLPLHIACRFPSLQQIDVVQYMIHVYPYAVQCSDVWGNFPLHEACSNPSVALEVVLMLLNLYSDAAKIPNFDGNLPLHLAVSSRTPENDRLSLSLRERQLEIVQFLLCYWPEAIHCANLKGETALQMARNHSNNALLTDFLQEHFDMRVLSSSLRVDKIAEVELCQSGSKQPINPFDDDFCFNETPSFPVHLPAVSEVNVSFLTVSFQKEDICSSLQTAPFSDTSLIDEQGMINSLSESFGALSVIEPEDDNFCVELVEDFQIVVDRNWSI